MSYLEKLVQKILAGKKISYKDAERILLKLGFKVKVTGHALRSFSVGWVPIMYLEKLVRLIIFHLKNDLNYYRIR